MAWWKELNTVRRTWIFVGLGLALGAVIVACSVSRESNSPMTAAKSDASSKTKLETTASRPPPTALVGSLPALDRNQPTVEGSAPVAPKRVALSPEAAAELRRKITVAPDYKTRVEARRALFQALRRDGQVDAAMREFDAFLDDIEQNDSSNMAQHAAFNTAGVLQVHRDYATAHSIYERLLSRWPDTLLRMSALGHIAECQLALRHCAAAERTSRRIIEEFDFAYEAPCAWRQLALAQLLQGQVEEALSTLSVMEQKYKIQRYNEYARQRRRSVLTLLGRDASNISKREGNALFQDSAYEKDIAKAVEAVVLHPTPSRPPLHDIMAATGEK